MTQIWRKMIGNYIRDRRQMLGWSRSEAAERLGVSPQMLGRMEGGQADIEPILPDLIELLSLDPSRIRKVTDYAIFWFADMAFKERRGFRVFRASKEKREKWKK